MPEIAFRSFLSSKPFLVFGPKRTLFYAHGDLISQCSAVLAIDVNGGMREAETKTINIEDVDGDIDGDTVMRFIEYAYTGDYTVPEPEVLQLPTDTKFVVEAFTRAPVGKVDAGEDDKPLKRRKKKKNLWHHDIESVPVPYPEDIAEQEYAVERDVVLEPDYAIDLQEATEPDYAIEPQEATEPDYVIEQEEVQEPENESLVVSAPQPDPFKADVTTKTSRRNLWTQFCSQAYMVERQKPWEPPANNDQREDYTALFLCHARLYKFSDRYECHKLMELSLQRLRLTLSRYKFHQERASDIVELVRYTYAHTVGYESGFDKLRSLVLEYAMCYFVQLTKEPNFMKLMHEGGDLVTDMMTKLSRLVD